VSYALSADAEAAIEPASARRPPYALSALALMGVTAIPWVPVAVGAWLGGRYSAEHGKLVGGAVGFLISFLTLIHVNKQMGGQIT